MQVWLTNKRWTDCYYQLHLWAEHLPFKYQPCTKPYSLCARQRSASNEHLWWKIKNKTPPHI